MNEAPVRALNNATIKECIEAQGYDVRPSNPEECGRFMNAQIVKGRQVLTANSILADG